MVETFNRENGDTKGRGKEYENTTVERDRDWRRRIRGGLRKNG